MSIEETFKLAIENHQKNNLKIAVALYKKVLEIDPNLTNAHNNLGKILSTTGDYQGAINCFEKVIEINPNYAEAHNSLGIMLSTTKEFQRAITCFEKAIKINPNYAEAHNNLGKILSTTKEFQRAITCSEKAIEIDPNFISAHNNLGIILSTEGEYQRAISCFKKAIEIDPNFVNAYNNLGTSLGASGEYQKAKFSFEKAIEINPNFIEAHNNLGVVFDELGEYQKSKSSFEKVIQIDPNYSDAYWNLHGHSLNIDEALSTLKKLYKIDNNHIDAKITISALQGYKGDFRMFDMLLNTSDSSLPITRSIKWVFSLPKLPKIYFNKWAFFEKIIPLTDNSRPFYEFGVFTGVSFKYLIDTFKKGFGFDTFSGLPEDWHNNKKGTYSALGVVPKIDGGEFIVGKFEDTLPNFFSKDQPVASLINFDADLYSSTLCALNNSNKVIDEKTILVFDEFLMNAKWEEDEYKALNEFCDNLGYSYEVIAISFFTKQVAVKLKKI